MRYLFEAAGPQDRLRWRYRPNGDTAYVQKNVNLAEKLSSFSDYWPPHAVTEFNGHDVMFVKVLG